MEKPALLIPLKSWIKIMAYVDAVDTEITGFFDVEYNPEDNQLEVGEVFLIEQTASGGDVEMDEDAISQFMVEMIKKGKEQMPRGWWHSHVNMNVFWSGTDETTITKDFTNDTYTVSLVVNKKRECKAVVMIWDTVPADHILAITGAIESVVRIDDLPVRIKYESNTIPAAIQKEVDSKVKSKSNKFDFNWSGKKNKSLSTMLWLPKSTDAALEKIDEYQLIHEYNTDVKEWIWRNPKTDTLWVDHWGAMEGIVDETQDRTGPAILVNDKCAYCHYKYPNHNQKCPYKGD